MSGPRRPDVVIDLVRGESSERLPGERVPPRERMRGPRLTAEVRASLIRAGAKREAREFTAEIMAAGKHEGRRRAVIRRYVRLIEDAGGGRADD